MVGMFRAVFVACVGILGLAAAGEPPTIAQPAATPTSQAATYFVLGERDEPATEQDANADDLDGAPAETAAVAPPASQDERCLAVAVYYESRGEPLAGQAAVARVILNRVASGRFASSVCGVIRQPGQFSFSHSATPPANADWRVAQTVAHAAMSGEASGPAADALYFHASYVAPAWGRARIATIGHHIFYR